MIVRIATDEDKEKWNSYVTQHDAFPPTNRYEWKYILERSYGLKTFFFLIEDADATIKGLCGAYVTKNAGNETLYSLRFGFLAEDAQGATILLSHIKQFCIENGIIGQLLTSGYTNFSTLAGSQTQKTVTIHLAGSEEAMWEGLRNKTRNMIRKAQNAGLTVARGFENVHAFYRIYTRRMLAKNVPIHSLNFFIQIARELPSHSKLLVAKRDGVPVAGMLLLVGGRTAIYPYQASTIEGERFAANQLLIWEVMQYCAARGMTTLDMGESREGSPVYQSKINFGGTPRDVYYYHDAESTSPHFSSIALKVFPHLPLLLKKPVGVWLRKQGRIL